MNLLLKQAYNLAEPWTMTNSLKNIEEFLLIITNFYEWKLQSHINSKFRDDMVPLLFTKDMRFKFVEMIQIFEDTLTPSSSTLSPLALCYETDKSETGEMANFTAKLESAACPANEEKRLNFWLSSVRKLSQQMRQLSLYTEDKKSNAKPSFYENPQRNTQNKQGGASLKIRCIVCPNQHMSAKGKPTQYLGTCEFFKNQSLNKQKELVKQNKICFVCLSPMSACRKDPDFKTCT